MAEKDPSAKHSSKFGKSLGDIFSTLGAIANPIGKVLLGPGAAGIDFGMPFATVGALINNRHQEKGLMDALSGDPTVGPIMQQIAPLADQPGGALGMLQQSQQPQPQRQPIDFGSPEFLQKLIGSGNNQLANQIIMSKATQKPLSALDIELAKLKLLGGGLDLKKTQAEIDYLKAKPQPPTIQEKNTETLARQKELVDYNASIAEPPAARAKLHTDVQDLLGRVTNISSEYDSLLENPNVGPLLKDQTVLNKLSVYLGAKTNEDSERAAAALVGYPPELLNAMANLKDLDFSLIKSMSGLSYTDKQLGEMQKVTPNVLSDPRLVRSRLTDLGVAARVKALKDVSTSPTNKHLLANIRNMGYSKPEDALEKFQYMLDNGRAVREGKAPADVTAVYKAIQNDLGLALSFEQ